MKSWLRKIDSGKHEIDRWKESEKVHNVNWDLMEETKQKEKTEIEQDLREAYEIHLRQQRKYEGRRNVDEKECCSQCRVQRWLCEFLHRTMGKIGGSHRQCYFIQPSVQYIFL